MDIKSRSAQTHLVKETTVMEKFGYAVEQKPGKAEDNIQPEGTEL